MKNNKSTPVGTYMYKNAWSYNKRKIEKCGPRGWGRACKYMYDCIIIP